MKKLLILLLTITNCYALTIPLGNEYTLDQNISNIEIINNGILNIKGTNINGPVKIINNGTIDITGNINYNNKLIINNHGIINSQITFDIKNNSIINNFNFIKITGEFNSENTTILNNYGQIEISGNFNPNGKVYNKGLLNSLSFININPSSEVTNDCLLNSEKGFNNNSHKTINNGHIRCTGMFNKVQINSTFTQSNNALLEGYDFTNNSIIKGSGNYLFQGYTVNQGQFNTNDTVYFFDNTSNGSKFDIENIKTGNNVIRKFIEPFTYSNCTKIIIDLLPIELSYFKGIQINEFNYIQWETLSEYNVKEFQLYRSYDFSKWELIHSIKAFNSNEPKHYSYYDKPNKSAYYKLVEITNDNDYIEHEIIYVDYISDDYFIFPNPVNNIINTNFEFEYSWVINNLGNVVYKGKDLSNLTIIPGSYIIYFKINDTIKSFNIIVV